MTEKFTRRDPAHDWLKDWPNRLTLVRILAIPLLLLIYPLDFRFTNVLCTLIFAVAAITDFLDGYLARRYNLQTTAGALMDPIADKMLIASALILVVHAQLLPPWMAGVLLCRDIAVSGIRLVALEQKLTIEVSQVGKVKTFFEDIGIICLLLRWDKIGDFPLRNVGMISMWIALLLSAYSAYIYTKTFLQKAKLQLP